MMIGLAILPTSFSGDSIESNSTSMSNKSDTNLDGTGANNPFTPSQDTLEGILNPNSMTQRGKQATGVFRARTDSGKNAEQNITIDESKDWEISRADVEVTNLRKLYAVNGTFDDEVSPWTSSTYDPSGGLQTQSAVWNSTEGYVTCVNYGEYTHYNNKDDTYTHHLDTLLLWEQTVVNSPQTNNFSLSFRYRYVSGPVDLEPYDFSGDVELRIFVHTDIYFMSIATGDLRNVWYSVTDYPIDLVGAPGSFTVGIGIYVRYDDIILTENGDYDNDGNPDGLVNAEKIEVNLDDFEFKSQTPLAYDSVNLTFNAGGLSNSITGPTGGTGTSTITNPSMWSVDPLTVEVTADSAVTFDYFVTTYFQKSVNTSWTTDLAKHGVVYSIDVGQSAFLESYTYITTSSVYENLTLEIDFPSDWDNTTILDPLQNDITGLCTVSTGSIFIPNSLFDRVGWWKITHQAYNYAKNISIQIYDNITESWTESYLFRTGNLTRTQIEIGTATLTPTSGSPVQINYVLPNGTIWASDSISTIINGYANSSSLTFGGSNTSAGEWEVQLYWNNGTEIAYGFDTFDLYHQASATVKYPMIETDWGIVLSNQITLIDADTGHYLLDDSVSITANWSDTTVEFTQNFAKNWWQGEFDTELLENGAFTVVVDISRPYFDPITTQFTVVSIFETNLAILNAGTIPIDGGLNEIFTVQLNYELLNGSGIIGASPSLFFTGTDNGLSWSNFTDNKDGTYTMDIVCNVSDTYGITITLSKPYYYNSSDSFTLIIGETGTELELINGTADFVSFEESYRLVVQYRNSTGQGLQDANLQVITTTPSTGLVYSNFTYIDNGYYEITLTPSTAGTFSIFLRASLVNHETQFVTFTLTANTIPTILTPLTSEKTVAINQTFTLQLRFLEEEDLNPIIGAQITLVNPPAGLLYSNVTYHGSGLYNITLQSFEIMTYDLLFRAYKNNYQISSAGFTFVVTEIQTTLHFEGDVSSTTVEFAEPYELIVYFDRTDSIEAIQGANITVYPVIAELDIKIEPHIGYYVVTIRGNDIGSWTITVIAEKENYRSATKSFFIEIEGIDTTLEGANPLETLLIGRSYNFTFNYIFETNNSEIRGATISAFGAGADWVSYVEQGSGTYTVTLTPQELGQHIVTLVFERLGFASSTFRLTFNVGKVPLLVEIIQGHIALESTPSIVVVRVTEADTGQRVSGIQVFCYIVDPNGASSSSISMEETSTAGEYSATITMPIAEGTYKILISCEATNYVLSSAYSINLQPERSITSMIWITTTRYYPFLIALVFVGFGLVYRRSSRKKRIRENKETLAIKRRFDDIRSLLGVIVLHKDSGLPVYSKILRAGLEETVISAFITAITSFRGEFDIETTSEEWGLIPISDIVRVISTNKLVCAFITTGNPSPEQRERMIQFAKQVGFIFDETMEDVPVVVLDRHTTAQFDTLFEDLLDGQLLRTFKLDETKKFPTTSCANERIARKHGEEFKLEELASEIASCGLEEGRVYKAIMVALENHFLVTTDDSPFATELLRASDIVEEEG